MPMFGFASSSSCRYLISFALVVTGCTKTHVFHSECASSSSANVSPRSSSSTGLLARIHVSRTKSSRR
jgi:hypothetical protein